MSLAIITFSAVLSCTTIQYVGIKGNCNKSKHQLHKVSSDYYTLKEKEVFGLNLTDFQNPPLVGGFLIDLDTWKSYQNLGLSLRGVTCNTSMAEYI